MNDLEDLLVIVGVAASIMLGLLFGVFLTFKAIEFFIDSLRLFQ